MDRNPKKRQVSQQSVSPQKKASADAHPSNNRSRSADPRRSSRQNIPVSNKPPMTSSGGADELKNLFSVDNLKQVIAVIKVYLQQQIGNFLTNIFLSKERIICIAVTGVVLLFLALLQTTLFSTIRPFGMVPDLMLSFTLALSVTEGRRWGAVWGIIAAVVIESLNVPSMYLLPLLYMLTGYFGGVICRHFLTESFVVRAILAVAVLPLRGVFSAIYAFLSPLSITPSEVFFNIVLPEAGATLLLAAPVHILVYFCMRPFHHTRAEMVSER